MNILPVVNCRDKKCVESRLAVIQALGSPWIHVDVADGIFASPETVGDPALFARSGIKIDAHLMVQHPEVSAHRWRQVASRITVHIESAPLLELTKIRKACARENIEFGVAVSLETDVHRAEPLIRSLAPSLIHILAVPVGPSGQRFNDEAVERVKFFRTHFPKVPIEVDGGVTPEIAGFLAKFGATHAAVSSYIFGSKDPKSRWLEFQHPLKK